jgi:hypothetical protein
MRDLREIGRLRLRNQRVMAGGFGSAAEAVGWLGAVQSQDYPMAKWSVAKRVPGLREPDIDSDLLAGTILRTHILRPTWHFVLPADLRPMMALTAPRIYGPSRVLGVNQPNDAVMRRGIDAIGAALAGGVRLTRAELIEALLEQGIVTNETWTVPIFIAAELDLVIVSGGLAGKAHTYALVDDVVPAAAAFDRDWAMAELTRRYFSSHGPATIPDFTWWSSLTVADTKRGIEVNAADGRALERLTVDGTDYWWAGDTSDPAAADDPSPTAHLMQAYDEYIVAYRAPRNVINVDSHGPPSALNRPPMLHEVIIDGQLAGWWRRVPKRDAVVVEVAPLREFSQAEVAAIEAAAQRYGTFLGAPVSVSL